MFDGNPAVGSPRSSRSQVGSMPWFATSPAWWRTYTIKGTTNLVAGAWTNTVATVTNSADQTGINIPADYTRKEFTVPATNGQFFRVEAVTAP